MQTRQLPAALLSCLLAGCTREPPRAGAASVAGLWHLATVQGHTLPYADPGPAALVRGSLELAPDGQFVETEEWSGHYLGSTTPRPADHAVGRYSLHGDTVLLHFEGPEPAALVLDDAGRLTLHLGRSEGEVWVYRRDPG
jgi:hypothetical protein